MNTITEKGLLSKKEISETPIRTLILCAFLKNKLAFSLKDLKKELYFSDKSTIFRTLQLFEKNGLVHGIIDSKGIKSYALCNETCKNE